MNTISERKPCPGPAPARRPRGAALAHGVVLAALLVLWGQCLPAQTSVARRPQANRWLIVVQTTSSMQPRAAAVADLAAMLVASGMGEQMHDGDSLGLWTFNEQLYTGLFPLERWVSGKRKIIADRVYDFVKGQKFEKNGQFNSVLFDLDKVIQNSELLTVVLLTDGREPIRGTPFDSGINKVYNAWKEEQEKAHFPFITVLRAQHGQLTHYTVTVPPWPLEMPPMPVALEPPQPAVTATSAPTFLPPLIVSGKKHENPPAMTAPTAEQSNANPTEITASVPMTPQPSATASTETPRTQSAEAPAPSPGNAGPEPVSMAKAASAEPPPPPAATPVTESRPPEPVASAPESPSGSESRPIAAIQAGSTPTPETAAQTAVATPPSDFLSRKKGWLIPLGIAALVVTSFALGVVFDMVRRMRSPRRISLITRSLDQEKK
jgi:hypothetical protein